MQESSLLKKITFWVRFCVSTLAVFENVFDITVFVNSMKMHFPNNLYMLFMTMPSVKKMYYILCVQRLKINFFLCFLMTLGLNNKYSPTMVFIPLQSHLTASWFTQHFCESNTNEPQSVWTWEKSNGLFMCVFLVSWAIEIIYFGVL